MLAIANFKVRFKPVCNLWFLFAAAAAYFSTSISAYYPPRIFFGFLTIVGCFAAISFWRPVLGGTLLISLGAFFGNHPGGRFMEIFDILLL
ncbi:MAG: hypothetical protein KDK33_08890, partial [Leptospiraceae bacterium]|nr:hypothetical protein [Leptospiraceae bacterium]